MNFRKISRDITDGFLISWNANRTYAIYNLALSLTISLLPIVSLWYIREIIDIVTRYKVASREDFIYALITLVIIQLIQAGLQQVLQEIQTIQQQSTIDYLSRKVLEKAIQVEYPYYENASYFDNLHLAQQEVNYRGGLITNGFNQLIQSGFTLITISVVLLQFKWWYAVLVIAASIPVLWIKKKHAKDSQELERQNIQRERAAGYLSRTLTDSVHAKEVRTFLFGEYLIAKFTALRERIFWGRKKLAAAQSWSETLIQAIEILIVAAVILSLGLNTLDGVITAGTFVFYLQALQRVQSGFRNFITAFTALFRQRFFISNINTFFQLPTKAGNESSYNLLFPGNIREGISLNKVSFTYPDAVKPVLQNLDMHFKPGTVTAIVGENGSGKTTLVKLLAKLYQPSTGNITIDAVDVQSIQPSSYAQHTSVLFQDFNQFHFSLRENIGFSNNAEEEKVQRASAAAGVHSIADQLKNGYDTSLGKMFGDDQQLSGGQWQKIAIARTLYRDSTVCILDEPTSNIDPVAEYEILRNIVAEKGNKIIILITHRLHNLKFADHVYLLNGGKVSSEGSVESLLQKSELFREMYQRQMLENTSFTLI